MHNLEKNYCVKICVSEVWSRIKGKNKQVIKVIFFSIKKSTLLRSNQSKITNDKTEQKVSKIKNTDVVFVHCNRINYMRLLTQSKILCSFVLNKIFRQVLEIKPSTLIFHYLKFLCMGKLSTDQGLNRLELEKVLHLNFMISPSI